MIALVLPDYQTEDGLLDRARAGDEQAMTRIYDDYFPPVYQYIRLRVGDAALAEDLAADVFVRLVKAFRGHTAPRHSLRGWLFQVARNLIHDRRGRDGRLPQATLQDWMPASSEHEPETQVMRGYTAERLRAALGRLNAEQQEVVVLRFGQMLSLQETADIMGKSVSAVKALQFRAVQTLRALLEPAIGDR